MWAGIISILATVIALFKSEAGYGMSLAINIFLNRLIQALGLSKLAT